MCSSDLSLRPHQAGLIEAARRGQGGLVIAPTGGGKTLAGFLPSLIELAETPPRVHPALHTLYISPLKALATDVARNLKSPVEEMKLGLEHGIHQFNVESMPELLRLSRVAEEMGKTAPIAFRVNPHVEAGGHAHISTGSAEHKFGIAWHEAEAFFEEASRLPGIAPVGIAVHIGSQITDLGPMEAAFRLLAEFVTVLRGDWARRDPVITRYLTAQGAAGVPLYMWYPAKAAPPRQLPQVLTPALLAELAGEAS